MRRAKLQHPKPLLSQNWWLTSTSVRILIHSAICLRSRILQLTLSMRRRLTFWTPHLSNWIPWIHLHLCSFKRRFLLPLTMRSLSEVYSILQKTRNSRNQNKMPTKIFKQSLPFWIRIKSPSSSLTLPTCLLRKMTLLVIPQRPLSYWNPSQARKTCSRFLLRLQTHPFS